MASTRRKVRKHKPTHKNKWRDILQILSNLVTVALPLVKLFFYIYNKYHH